MNIRVRRIVAGVLVAASGVVALATMTTGVAQAAPVTVPGCTGDTAGVAVTVDDAAFAGDRMVPIHDNTAGVRYPAPTDAAMSSPICGARLLADGSFRREWLYCTVAALNTCATEPLVRKGNAATGVSSLTATDRARLAWLMDNLVRNGTAAERIASQRLVWCVTEGAGAGAVAPGYFHDARDDQNLRCPNWPAVDPTLVPSPTIALAGPAAPVAPGATARFTLTTNASPIQLTATGLTGLDVCPGGAGASLAAGVLTIAAPDVSRPVALCATRSTEGTGSLRAVVAQRAGTTLEFWQRDANVQFCQGMLSTETLSNEAVAARADAVFAAEAPTTTTTVAPTTVGPTTVAPTTTTDPTQTTPPTAAGTTTTLVILETVATSPRATLPRTGSTTETGVFWAFVLLLAGICLAALGRTGDAKE
jgi:hypothetical protein